MNKDKGRSQEKKPPVNMEFMPKYWFTQEGWEELYDLSISQINKGEKNLLAVR